MTTKQVVERAIAMLRKTGRVVVSAIVMDAMCDELDRMTKAGADIWFRVDDTTRAITVSIQPFHTFPQRFIDEQ